MRAYNNNPAIKAQVLSATPGLLADNGVLRSLPLAQEDLKAFCARVGLDEAFVHLLRGLTPALGSDEAQQAFVKKILGLMPVGSDSRAIVVEWFQWLWSGHDRSLEQDLKGSAAEIPARNVIAMLAANDAEPATRQERRNARRELQSIGNLSIAEQNAVDIVSLFTWDLSITPGVTEDLPRVLETNVSRLIDHEVNWTETDQAIVRQYEEKMVEHYPAARERAGEMPDQADQDAFGAYLDKIDEILVRQFTDRERDVHIRLKARNSAFFAALAQAKRSQAAQFEAFIGRMAERSEAAGVRPTVGTSAS